MTDNNASVQRTYAADQYPAYLVCASDSWFRHNLHDPIGRREYKTYAGARRRACEYAAAHPKLKVRIWGRGEYYWPNIEAWQPNWYVVHCFENGELLVDDRRGQHGRAAA